MVLIVTDPICKAVELRRRYAELEPRFEKATTELEPTTAHTWNVETAAVEDRNPAID
jgi:hypothetical protein